MFSPSAINIEASFSLNLFDFINFAKVSFSTSLSNRRCFFCLVTTTELRIYEGNWCSLCWKFDISSKNSNKFCLFFFNCCFLIAISLVKALFEKSVIIPWRFYWFNWTYITISNNEESESSLEHEGEFFEVWLWGIVLLLIDCILFIAKLSFFTFFFPPLLLFKELERSLSLELSIFNDAFSFFYFKF